MGFILVRPKSRKYDIELEKDTFSLDDKVNHFIDWYRKNENKDTKDIENIIEKVVSWYEMRYPNSSLERNANSICIDNEKSWTDLLDYKRFYSLLSKKEKALLDKPKFDSIVTWNGNNSYHMPEGSFFVEGDGTITSLGTLYGNDKYFSIAHSGERVSGNLIFKDKNIRDVERVAFENDIVPRDVPNVRDKVFEVERNISIWEGLWNSILYRVISRGGDYYGPKRGMLFAKEFDLSRDIPVKYGASCFDVVDDYIQNGGDPNLNSYFYYFNGKTSAERSTIKPLSTVYGYNDNEKDKPKVYVKNRDLNW